MKQWQNRKGGIFRSDLKKPSRKNHGDAKYRISSLITSLFMNNIKYMEKNPSQRPFIEHFVLFSSLITSNQTDLIQECIVDKRRHPGKILT